MMLSMFMDTHFPLDWEHYRSNLYQGCVAEDEKGHKKTRLMQTGGGTRIKKKKRLYKYEWKGEGESE